MFKARLQFKNDSLTTLYGSPEDFLTKNLMKIAATYGGGDSSPCVCGFSIGE